MFKTLNNGISMPLLGLGTFRAEEGDQTYQAVLAALHTGYRHIDTAQAYNNEASVGKAISDSGLSREELFITTKLGAKNLGYQKAKDELNGSLKKMNLDYIDLYLIHWPSHNPELNKETWRAFEELYFEGKVKAVGVSNFQKHHLMELLKFAEVKPCVNQVELHPGLQQWPLEAYCASEGIHLVSYGPLMKGEVFEMPVLQELAKKYNKSVPNIIARWGIQRGIFMIPKSVTKERIVDNFNIFDFYLTDEDMAAIKSINRGKRVYTDPDNAPHVAI